MQIIESLHLLKDQENFIAFHSPSYSIIDLSPDVYQVLSLASVGYTEKEIAYRLDIPEYDIHNLFNNLNQKLNSITIPNILKDRDDIGNIYRITLHIANDCNLRCKYCYATGGNYNLKRGLMSYATADSFISFCTKTFKTIENIVFFGGEPLLNYEIIDYICNQFKILYSQSKVQKIPTFGIITNGTLMNKKILEILNKHISFITVSIDGPQIINDANRVFPNGKGSYKKIISFIKTIRECTNISIKYESTYTDIHIKNGFTHDDIYSYFYSLGLEGIVTDDINLKKAIDIPKKTTFVSEFSNLNLPEGFWSVLAVIAYKQPKQICQVFRKIFAVSTIGDIYACHMDNGNKHARLGDIFSENIFNTPKMYLAKHPLFSNLTNKDKLCGNFWAKNICAGCTRKWFFDEKEGKYSSTPHTDLCSINKEHLDKIILMITKIRKDNNLWNSMLNVIYKN